MIDFMEKQQAQAKLQERLKLFDDTLHFRDTERTLFISNGNAWGVLDSDTGAKLSEVMSDWSLHEKISREFQERYEWDFHDSPVQVGHDYRCIQTLGHSMYIVNDDAWNIQTLDEIKLMPDEYDSYTADPIMHTWTVIWPRFFGSLTYGQIQDAVMLNKEYQQYRGHLVADVMLKEYGVPLGCDCVARDVTNDLLNFYRGMRGLADDMRKRPEKIEALIASGEDAAIAGVRKAAENPSGLAAFTMMIPSLGQCIMSKKQYERFIWPTLKKQIDICVEHDRTINIYAEADFLRMKDMYQDIPKGTCMLYDEIDDVREVRKQLPNFAIQGGMPTELLGMGTAEECVNYAKGLIDEMGNGFAFTTIKGLVYRIDAKRENLLAVKDFVLNYRR